MAVVLATRVGARLRLRYVLRVAAVVVGALVAGGLFVQLALSALGITPRVVISGSMEPVYPIGTVVLTQDVPAESVTIGDVVTTERFNGPGTVTHRVVAAAPGGGHETVLTLRGDANDGVDREPYVVTEVGVTRLAIPYAGLPQMWLQDLFGAD